MLFNPNWNRKVTAAGQVLLDTATLLEVEGWCQGRMVSADGRRCVMGAINATHGSFAAQHDALLHFFAYLGKPIPKWNDHPGRTVEDVTTFLRAAAKTAP